MTALKRQVQQHAEGYEGECEICGAPLTTRTDEGREKAQIKLEYIPGKATKRVLMFCRKHTSLHQ